ncbi:MAG TPA: hypothetical protein VFY29_17510 [Terriglobia bacterium]|nr:hypothetical protein [Terriglobia bacterium]
MYERENIGGHLRRPACRDPVAADFEVVPNWLKLPEGRASIGNMRGDVAVSAAGEVFVSVQEQGAGVQVYSPEGTFLRNLLPSPVTFTAL